MKELIRVEEQFYILATAAHDDRTRVLKHDDTFALFGPAGNIGKLGRGDQGLYHQGTRFLSRQEMRISGLRPLLLSSSVLDSNALLAVDLTNPDMVQGGQVAVPHGDIHIFRTKFLDSGECHERLRFQNFGLRRATLEVAIELEADFLDIFEVRGTRRARRGPPPRAEVDGDALRFVYTGLDGVRRTTRVHVEGCQARASPGELRFELQLDAGEEQTLYVLVECLLDEPPRQSHTYDEGLRHVADRHYQLGEQECRISTSNGVFNAWLDRSLADLRMMQTQTPHGLYPYAGVPWYSTPFGRDALITAQQALWFQPSLARGVLKFLAATQAKALEPERDAEPGKILHELRRGEMAALGEIPFGRYYGTVDATPLFLMLASEYFQATGDRALVEEIWPNLEAAAAWLFDYGDSNGDGFIDYSEKATRGLSNQGWKDSADSVFHAGGELAKPPIALCEVQGYAYAGLLGMSRLAEALGRGDRAKGWRRDAEALQQRFERAFWCEELSSYALALDGAGRPCRVRASNAGHCLYTGIASPERAARTARTLTTRGFFSGWGIRTVAEGEARYNPMSYHNGSIWPHDNALIAAGFARYGLKDSCLQVLKALFEASTSFELRRIPELYCGFLRRAGEGPTLYPVACSPQAWASGSVLMLLGACLGLEMNAAEHCLRLRRPALPEFLDEVTIEGLRVGEASVDVSFYRYARGAGVDVRRRDGGLEVLIVK